MNKITLLVGFLAAVSLSIISPKQEQQSSVDQSKFMQRKLEFTKEIIAGLAMEDFGRISKGSQDLMLLSSESNWNSVNSPAYLKASSDFRETVERLRTASKQKNLDAATLAYFEVTMNCVRCHKQIRNKFKTAPQINQKGN